MKKILFFSAIFCSMFASCKKNQSHTFDVQSLGAYSTNNNTVDAVRINWSYDIKDTAKYFYVYLQTYTDSVHYTSILMERISRVSGKASIETIIKNPFSQQYGISVALGDEDGPNSFNFYEKTFRRYRDGSYRIMEKLKTKN